MLSKITLAATATLVAATALHAQNPTVPVTSNVTRAVVDPALRNGNNTHAMWWNTGEMFLFASDGRLTQDIATGTAHLSGRLISKTDRRRAFDVEVNFSGHSFAPPANSPKLEGFFNSSYAVNGGPIDPSTWYYYTNTTGTLTGIRDFAGAQLDITRRGPSFQLGHGANVKNDNYGASGWFDIAIISQPTNGGSIGAARGDFNIDLNPDCVSAEGSHFESPFWKWNSTYAFKFTGIGCGDQYDFIAPAIVKSDDAAGTMNITGEIAARANSNCRFVVDLEFSTRIMPGDSNHPPSGSPNISFASSYLEANGGPIDPAAWVYYDSIQGTLSGRGDLAGARGNITLRGDAAQIGLGASRRIERGAAFKIDVAITRQPNTGPTLANTDADVDFIFSVGSLPQICELKGARQKLLTVTGDCFTVRGCVLDLTTAIQFAGQTITSQDPCDLGLGFFKILSSEELCVYPPLCLAPGMKRIEAENAAGEGTGRITVELETPLDPTMATTPELMVGKTQRFYVHNGTGPNSCPGPAIVYLILSSSPQPTIIPGFVNAQLGDMARSYICGPGRTSPDCIELGGYTIPQEFAGTRLYTQSLFFCMPNPMFPVPITNREQTDYR